MADWKSCLPPAAAQELSVFRFRSTRNPEGPVCGASLPHSCEVDGRIENSRPVFPLIVYPTVCALDAKPTWADSPVATRFVQAHSFNEMNAELANKKCRACEESAQALKGDALARLKQQLGDNWKVIDEHHLEKEYSFKNFKEALDFTNRVGAIAEQEGHHPDISLG